jgi:hypothetical protein
MNNLILETNEESKRRKQELISSSSSRGRLQAGSLPVNNRDKNMVIENDSRGKIKEKRKIKKRKDLTLQDMKRSPRRNRKVCEIEPEISPSIHDSDLRLSVSDKDSYMVGSKDNIGLISLPKMPVRRSVLKR